MNAIARRSFASTAERNSSWHALEFDQLEASGLPAQERNAHQKSGESDSL